MNLKAKCANQLPPELLDAWEKAGIVDGLPIQIEAIDKGILNGASLLVVAPTSSGKTFLGEMCATQHAMRGSRAIYLVPFKAIAEERFAEFTERYRDNPDIALRCIVSDRDHHENDAELLVGKFDIAILTYEKLAALLVASKAILDVCSCVIVDEVQMISDPNRGATLELILTKLRRLKVKPQIICLSAVLGRLSGFDQWLGVTALRADHRPVELRLGVADASGKFNYREWNTANSATENIDGGSLEVLVADLLRRNEQILIFAASVPQTEKIARSLLNHSPVPASRNAIQELKDEADTETREILLDTLVKGIAIHNADCDLPERLIVERGFRVGDIRVIVSTTTLSMGINMPVDNVILADNERWTKINGAWVSVPWTSAEVQNILGRAGRFGKGASYGRGILLAKSPGEKRRLQNNYLMAKPEPLKSAFNQEDIDRRVLDVVAAGFAHTIAEVSDFLFDTFAGQAWSTARAPIQTLIDSGIDNCVKLELFEKTADGSLKVTPLGAVCSAQHCSLKTFADLKAYVLDISTFDHLDVAFAAGRTTEVLDAVKRIKWDDPHRAISIRDRLNRAFADNKLVGLIQTVFSFMVSNSSATPKPEFTIAAVCEEVLKSDRFMRELVQGFRISCGNLRQICESVGWMVDIMESIASILRPHLAPQFNEVAACLKRRAPLSCRLLDDLPSYVSRDERIRLLNQGITKSEDFLDLAPSQFNGVMSASKAERILDHLTSLRERSHEFWLRDHRRRLDRVGAQFSIVERMYADKGLELETSAEALLCSGCLNLSVQRIPTQRSGEPDLLLHFADGESFSVQVTAKDSNTKFVDSKKAGDVVPQSARFGVKGFICLGRPDFETLARESAGHLASQYNYKQLPVFVLCELYVLWKEGRISSEVGTSFIKDSRGYLTIKMLFAVVNPSQGAAS